MSDAPSYSTSTQVNDALKYMLMKFVMPPLVDGPS